MRDLSWVRVWRMRTNMTKEQYSTWPTESSTELLYYTQNRKKTDKFMSPLRVEITDLIHREKKSRRKCGNISGTNTRWSVLWETELNWGKYYVSRRNVSLGSPTVNFLFIFLSRREHRIDIRYLNNQGDLLRQLFTQVTMLTPWKT